MTDKTTEDMQMPGLALHAVHCLLENGFVTHGDQWVELDMLTHRLRAQNHLDKHYNGDTTEDHLLHAACRLLMAWERERKTNEC